MDLLSRVGIFDAKRGYCVTRGIALAGSSGSVFIVSAGWRLFQLNSL
jgi:hypothetical protein